MNELTVFENSEFGSVRTVDIDGKIYFVGSDVAKALGYAIPHKAVQTHCKGVLKRNIPTNSGNQDVLVITEGDMYRLISKSKLKSAERFEEWVFDEVLPSIRKTGQYGQARLPMTIPEQIQLLAQGNVELNKKVDGIQTELETLKNDLPILPIEAEKITNAVKTKGVHTMGGKTSNAYKNRSIVNAVYRDIYGQIYRNFGVSSYKALKRNQTNKAIEVVGEYKPPVILQDRIDNENAQQRLDV